MKFNKVILLAFIMLAIFTIGATCASDINETSDDLTFCEEIDEDSILNVESSAGDEVIGAGEGSFSDIQSMIDRALPGDTIVLSGNYLGTGTEITVKKELTIDGNNSKLDANAKSRIFNIEASNVVLKNLILVNANSPSFGGAVYWMGDNGNILNCQFENNKANDGGAVYYRGSNGIIENSTFLKNSAKYNGAVYMNSLNAKVTDCRFTENVASNSAGALGWVIKGGGVVSNSIFSKNSALYGGAIYINNATNFRIESSEFGDNVATLNGGAVYWDGGNRGTVTDSVFNKNRAKKYGGAIYADESDNIIISSNRFINCSSVEWGGAVYCVNPVSENLTVSDCNFEECSAQAGGAIRLFSAKGIIFGCSFLKCSSDYSGGAIFYSSNGTSSIFGCSFVSCSVEYGGGSAIYWDQENGKIENSSFINNNAEYAYTIATIGNIQVRNCKVIDKTISDMDDVIDGNRYNCNFVEKLTSKSDATTLTDSIPIWDEIIIVPMVYDQHALVYGDAELFINNKSMGTFKIGEKISFTPQELGTYNVSIKYAGDKNYLTSQSVNTTFEVTKITPKIDISYQDIEYGKNENIVVTLPKNVTGNATLTLTKNGQVINKSSFNLTGNVVSRIFSNLTLGVYNVTFEYSGDSYHFEGSNSILFVVRPIVRIQQDVVVGNTVDVYVDLINATGRIKLSVDGDDPISGYIVNNEFKDILPTDAFAYGIHAVTFEYIGDSIDKNVFSYWNSKTNTLDPVKYHMYLAPIIIVNNQDRVYSDDNGVIVLEFPQNATGTVDVEVYVDGYVGEFRHFVVNIVNGIARIDLSEFKDGNYNFVFRYSGDSKYAPFSKESVAILHNNVPARISANDLSIAYTSGKTYSVTVLTKTGKGVAGVTVLFSVNGISVGSAVTNANGVSSIKVSMAPGSYRITSKVGGISEVKTLKVNKILTLKSVNVKKSAKSLVLTASLAKVDGKYLKGKKITFKFNGKKYAAKTNKRGVAKITIKKSVLKKLKAGKKVAYQASYLKETVKRSVKIKK